jgi:uncharacterized lipoprotein YmbA
MKSAKFLLIAVAATASSLLGGCLSDILTPAEDPTVFHLIKASPVTKNSQKGIEVNLQPIQIPQYMSKVQIVSFDKNGDLDISEFDRWAELPANGIERALAINIESTGAASIFTYPAISPNLQSSYVLKVFIYELIGTLDGEVSLVGKWQIDSPKDKKSFVKNFAFKTQSKNGYSGYVKAFNNLIAELSTQISSELEKL